MYEELKTDIKQGNVILFIGAGVPATLGLPTWSELISKIASDLGYNDHLFMHYGNSLALAEFYELEKGRIGELRSWMDKNWSIDKDKIKGSNIYKTIAHLNFPLIYTTNYDHCLETAFDVWDKDYQKIVDVSDLVNIDLNTTQIIKFHGDIISDASIVLTERSYFNRLNFDSPLDVKLKADMLTKSILFIGYSLSDINVRLLIYKLDQVWQQSKSIKRPKSYVFLPTLNPIQEKILNNRGMYTIIGDGLDKTKSMEFFLNKLII